MHMLRFAVFLVVFFSLYGGMNYYIYRKLVPLFVPAHVIVAWIFLLLVLSPVILHYMIKADWLVAARFTAAIGYIWMGFAFLFFFLSLARDVARGALWLVEKYFHVNSPLAGLLGTPGATITIVLLAVIVSVYGVYSASRISITNVRFPSTKFPQQPGSLRIVQISDLHLDVLTSEARIERMVKTINALDPDVIVSTGDLVDMQADHIHKFADILRKLHAKYGCYAVTGNHEAISGIQRALTFTRDAGFTVLPGENRRIDDVVNIVGVDDPSVSRIFAHGPPDEAGVLKSVNHDLVTILLKHQPVINKASLPYFDLQLSGHVHGGQIFPFGLLTRLTYPVPMGLSQVAPKAWLYVSYGSGTWGPPLRFLAPPEVTVIDIISRIRTN